MSASTSTAPKAAPPVRPRLSAFIALTLLLAGLTFLGAVYYGVRTDFSIQWARTVPPFIGDLAVEKPLGLVAPTPDAAEAQLGPIDLDAIRRGEIQVPTIYIAEVPEDLLEWRTAADQKRLFQKMILPILLKVNDTIGKLRDRLEAIAARQAAGAAIDPEDVRFVDRLGYWYGVDDGDIDALLARVDIVPPSLAIAQAAEESGYGKSRFARIANALFGQHAFRPGPPVVEHQVAGVAPIRAFPDLISSISTYIHNLNTHRAYSDFRAARAALRKADKPLDSAELANHLTRYSERGPDYVATIHKHLSADKLQQFDKARLAP